jgi:hypothetical protein
MALTATAQQIEDLLYLVAHANGYRDWDWLDDWLTRGTQTLTPDEVIRIYASDPYWRAVEQGDIEQTESIRRAILGLD